MLLGGLRPHVLSHPVACFCFAVVLLCCCVAVLLCCCVAVLLGGGATEVSYPAGPPGAQPGFTIAATGFSYPGEPTTKTIYNNNVHFPPCFAHVPRSENRMLLNPQRVNDGWQSSTDNFHIF